VVPVSHRLSKSFEQRLQEASDRLAAMDRVSIRVENGVATRLSTSCTFDDLSDTSRTRAVSTLTVVRAVRRAVCEPAVQARQISAARGRS
jgi:hypothetical protein